MLHHFISKPCAMAAFTCEAHKLIQFATSSVSAIARRAHPAHAAWESCPDVTFYSDNGNLQWLRQDIPLSYRQCVR